MCLVFNQGVIWNGAPVYGIKSYIGRESAGVQAMYVR